MSIEFFKKSSDLVAAKKRFAIATVVLVEGSSSARPGSKAIIDEEGSLTGWIGGGCAEGTVRREALQCIAQARPSLIVLDLSMPEMDGYSLARAIRALPDYAAVPMVALSGFGSEADRAKSRAAGFDRHVLKPFDLSDLERMVELVG